MSFTERILQSAEMRKPRKIEERQFLISKTKSKQTHFSCFDIHLKNNNSSFMEPVSTCTCGSNFTRHPCGDKCKISSPESTNLTVDANSTLYKNSYLIHSLKQIYTLFLNLLMYTSFLKYMFSLDFYVKLTEFFYIYANLLKLRAFYLNNYASRFILREEIYQKTAKAENPVKAFQSVVLEKFMLLPLSKHSSNIYPQLNPRAKHLTSRSQQPHATTPPRNQSHTSSGEHRRHSSGGVWGAKTLMFILCVLLVNW